MEMLSMRVSDENKNLVKRVGIWIRVSTEDQAQGDSPAHHEERARHYASAKGWNVVEVYRLEGVSGKEVSKNSETLRMLADVKKGHIIALIFSKLARLARNTRDLLEFSDYFQKYGADLISLQEAIDTSSPAGRLFYTIIAAMAQWEREEIAERVSASVPVRARMGKPLGGAAPFGYQWMDGKLVPDEKEAPVRRLMYELYLKHRRKKAVSRELNDAGYRTRSGGRFSDTTIDRLLQDPTAKGLRRANYTKSLGDGKQWILKDKEDWVFHEVPAIVSEEVWNQANHLLAEQKAKTIKPGPRLVHLFGGLVSCHCGKKMYVPSNTPKYVCQSCRNKIPVQDLEAIYQEQLKDFLMSGDEMVKLSADAESDLSERHQLLEHLRKEEGQIRKGTDNLFRLYCDGGITSQSFGERHRPLESRLEEIQSEIPRLEAEIDFLKINILSADEVQHEAKDLASRWSHLSYEERRDIVSTITEGIVIGSDDITINLSYLPVASESMAKGQRNLTGSGRRPA